VTGFAVPGPWTVTVVPFAAARVDSRCLSPFFKPAKLEPILPRVSTTHFAGSDADMTRRRIKIGAVVLLMLLAGCSGWQRKMVFKKPAGSESIEIQQWFPVSMWGIRILLHQNGSTKTLYESRGDTFLLFADVLWSPDNEVAVFTCGNPALRMAYSLTANSFLPFERMRSGVAAHIQADYHLAPSKMSVDETFLWACTDGREAFSQHHQKRF